MLSKILFAELLLKGTAGLLLLLLPISTARVFGLPHGQVGFWARVLGGVLLAIAGAIVLEHDYEGIRGLGLGGLILFNVVGILVLMSFALMKGAGSRRGGLAIWLVIVVLMLLSLGEISQLGADTASGPLFRI